MLVHNVFFSLRDNSDAAKRQLVEDCHKYLGGIPGMIFYAAGTCSDMDRPVNDRDYDVALHTVFADKAAMQAYLEHPSHLEFVARHKPGWAKVRVFDSDASGASG
jgi:quinol monooxygenase YgiN